MPPNRTGFHKKSLGGVRSIAQYRKLKKDIRKRAEDNLQASVYICYLILRAVRVDHLQESFTKECMSDELASEATYDLRLWGQWGRRGGRFHLLREWWESSEVR